MATPPTRCEKIAAASVVIACFSSCLVSGRSLATSNYVLLETVALLQHRIGLEAVRDFQDRIVPLLRIRRIQEELHRRATERRRSDRRRLSLVDCSDAEGIREALTLDVDFAQHGYRVIPSS